MDIEEKVNLLKEYSNYLDSSKNGADNNEEVNETVIKIREYMETDPIFQSTITFLDVAPNKETREKIINEYKTSEINMADPAFRKARRMKMIYSSKSNYGFSLALFLTILVFILFITILICIIK